MQEQLQAERHWNILYSKAFIPQFETNHLTTKKYLALHLLPLFICKSISAFSPLKLWFIALSICTFAIFLLFSKKEEATLGDTQTTEAATTEEKTNEEPTQVETEDKQVEEQTEGKTITAKQESVHSWKTTLLVPKRSILTR